MRRMLFVLLTLLTLPALAYGQTETIEYYATDALGSIRVVYDANGNVLGRQDFTPFGTPVFNATAMPKEGFVGNEQDDETQQGYFHARMFSSRTGRFSSRDPLVGDPMNPQSLNRYAYALNNPLAIVDWSGLNADSAEQCTWVDVVTEEGYSSTLSCHTSTNSGGGNSAGGWVASILDVIFGAVPVGGPESEIVPTSNRRDTGGVETAVVVVATAASLVSPIAKAAEADAAATAAESVASKAVVGASSLISKVYHYTFAKSVDSILGTGLRPGSYVTPNGLLTPLQAQIELALDGPLRDSILEIDLAGLRQAGYSVPTPTRVAGTNAQPGGGWEIRFPYAVPPQFISVAGHK